ncbi:MAG: 2-oxoacid:acceptor oxidoreductase family protein [Patescibacteria group bacterium]
MKRITIKIAGPAGMGIKSAGLLLAKIVTNEGYYSADYSEYPSLIRGGHNTYQITISPEEVFMADRKADLLVALTPGHEEDGHNLLDIPLATMTAQLGGQIYANTISIGAIAYVLGLNRENAKKIVIDYFGKDFKNPEAFETGFAWAQKNSKEIKINKAKTNEGKETVIDGNEAFSWGLIKGGCNFLAAYPMTPVSGVLHFLAKNQDRFGIRVVHPEDELAVANEATGASIAGARVVVATSGGGFALMNEAISFGGMVGAGVVYFVGQRPGPATGMPTWTAQGDLLYSVFAGHGEFAKIVMAPGNTEECLEIGRKAINLANKYDIPVIVLADKILCESSKNLYDPEKEETIIEKSSKIVPGKGIYLYNSYEHDEEGFSTEDAEMAQKGVEKRLLKIKDILENEKDIFNYYGNKKASILIVSWGSTKGALLEAIRDSDKYAYLQIKMLWPLNKEIGKIINAFKTKILVENNATGQLGRLLRSELAINFDKTILKYDGRPFFAEEIRKELSIIPPKADPD